MRRLFVLYDADCGLCRRLASWLATEPALIPLLPLAAQSAEAARLFPGHAPGAELAVVSDQGAVWLGDHAWIMCLYALRNYRDWARKLSHPLLLPLAPHAYPALSTHPSTLSRFMGARELADRLGAVPGPAGGPPHDSAQRKSRS